MWKDRQFIPKNVAGNPRVPAISMELGHWSAACAAVRTCRERKSDERFSTAGNQNQLTMDRQQNEGRNNEGGNSGRERDDEGRFTDEAGNSSDSQNSGTRGAGDRSDNPGNFANDRERASEAGQKGGEASRGGNQGGSTQGGSTQSGGNRSTTGQGANSGNSGRSGNDRNR